MAVTRTTPLAGHRGEVDRPDRARGGARRPLVAPGALECRDGRPARRSARGRPALAGDRAGDPLCPGAVPGGPAQRAGAWCGRLPVRRAASGGSCSAGSAAQPSSLARASWSPRVGVALFTVAVVGARPPTRWSSTVPASDPSGHQPITRAAGGGRDRRRLRCGDRRVGQERDVRDFGRSAARARRRRAHRRSVGRQRPGRRRHRAARSTRPGSTSWSASRPCSCLPARLGRPRRRRSRAAAPD